MYKQQVRTAALDIFSGNAEERAHGRPPRKPNCDLRPLVTEPAHLTPLTALLFAAECEHADEAGRTPSAVRACVAYDVLLAMPVLGARQRNRALG